MPRRARFAADDASFKQIASERVDRAPLHSAAQDVSNITLRQSGKSHGLIQFRGQEIKWNESREGGVGRSESEGGGGIELGMSGPGVLYACLQPVVQRFH